tara:strand:+ start:245 stop:421 length:177 start_codon:yes stop_codon:yes gene_type:complete
MIDDTCLRRLKFSFFGFLLKKHKSNTKTPSFSTKIHEKPEKNVHRSFVAPKFVLRDRE